MEYSVFTIVSIIYGAMVGGDIILEVTDWGLWGNMDDCPKGKYASAFQLKTEKNQGGNNWDDSALNAVRLFCAEPSNPNKPDLNHPITSTVGPYGDWGQTFYCDGGIITGFQLRQEKSQGGAVITGGELEKANDDSAANNLRVFCSNKNEYIEGDGMYWGDWGREKKCLTDQAVCGIETQVEEYTKSGTYGIKGGDYAGLNNLKMKCCDTVTPAATEITYQYHVSQPKPNTYITIHKYQK